MAWFLTCVLVLLLQWLYQYQYGYIFAIFYNKPHLLVRTMLPPIINMLPNLSDLTPEKFIFIPRNKLLWVALVCGRPFVCGFRHPGIFPFVVGLPLEFQNILPSVSDEEWEKGERTHVSQISSLKVTCIISSPMVSTLLEPVTRLHLASQEARRCGLSLGSYFPVMVLGNGREA